MPSQDYYFLATKVDKLLKDVCCLRKAGVIILSIDNLIGDGSTTNFIVPHNQSSIPLAIAYTFRNSNSASGGPLWLNWDAVNIDINFVTPPGIGPLSIDFFIKL